MTAESGLAGTVRETSRYRVGDPVVCSPAICSAPRKLQTWHIEKAFCRTDGLRMLLSSSLRQSRQAIVYTR